MFNVRFSKTIMITDHNNNNNNIKISLYKRENKRFVQN